MSLDNILCSVRDKSVLKKEDWESLQANVAGIVGHESRARFGVPVVESMRVSAEKVVESLLNNSAYVVVNDVAANMPHADVLREWSLAKTELEQDVKILLEGEKIVEGSLLKDYDKAMSLHRKRIKTDVVFYCDVMLRSFGAYESGNETPVYRSASGDEDAVCAADVSAADMSLDDMQAQNIEDLYKPLIEQASCDAAAGYYRSLMSVHKNLITLTQQQLANYNAGYFVLNPELEKHFTPNFLQYVMNWLPIYKIQQHFMGEEGYAYKSVHWQDQGATTSCFGSKFSTDLYAQQIDGDTGKSTLLPSISKGSVFARMQGNFNYADVRVRNRGDEEGNPLSFESILKGKTSYDFQGSFASGEEYAIQGNLMKKDEDPDDVCQITMFTLPVKDDGVTFYSRRYLYNYFPDSQKKAANEVNGLLEIVIANDKLHLTTHVAGTQNDVCPVEYQRDKKSGESVLKKSPYLVTKKPTKSKTKDNDILSLAIKSLKSLMKSQEYIAAKNKYKEEYEPVDNMEADFEALQSLGLEHLYPLYMKDHQTTDVNKFSLLTDKGKVKSDVVTSYLVPVFINQATKTLRRNEDIKPLLSLAPHVVFQHTPNLDCDYEFFKNIKEKGQDLSFNEENIEGLKKDLSKRVPVFNEYNERLSASVSKLEEDDNKLNCFEEKVTQGIVSGMKNVEEMVGPMQSLVIDRNKALSELANYIQVKESDFNIALFIEKITAFVSEWHNYSLGIMGGSTQNHTQDDALLRSISDGLSGNIDTAFRWLSDSDSDSDSASVNYSKYMLTTAKAILNYSKGAPNTAGSEFLGLNNLEGVPEEINRAQLTSNGRGSSCVSGSSLAFFSSTNDACSTEEKSDVEPMLSKGLSLD